MTVLAIDIGGGGTRWALASGARGSGPALAVGSHGIDVSALLERTVRQSGEALRQDPSLIVLGMSGILGLANRALSAHDALRRFWPTARTLVCSDAVTALAGALGLAGGIVVAAGTGVIGLGTDLQDSWRRVDGWGHLLGDDGGGAWIGIQGLRAALRAHDGRTGGSRLLRDKAMERYGTLEGLPQRIYTRDDRATILAAFAPDVTAAAASDPVAFGILQDAGARLAETALAASGSSVPARCALTGGVREAGGALLESFETRLSAAGITSVAPRCGPLEGALRIGAALTEDDNAIRSRPPFITRENP